MKPSGTRALLISVAFAAMAMADVASGAERGDGRTVAGLGMPDPAEPADNAGATDREGPAEEIADRGGDGGGDPAGAAQEEDDPEAEYAAHDENGAIAPGPHIRRTGRSGDDGAPSAQRDSAQARAPPGMVSATATGSGA